MLLPDSLVVFEKAENSSLNLVGKAKLQVAKISIINPDWNFEQMGIEALLRPGTLETQMENSLPDEHGRVQILNIHTAQMRKFEKLANDVDLNELAALTRNFSGDELKGLVRAQHNHVQ